MRFNTIFIYYIYKLNMIFIYCKSGAAVSLREVGSVGGMGELERWSLSQYLFLHHVCLG